MGGGVEYTSTIIHVYSTEVALCTSKATDATQPEYSCVPEHQTIRPNNTWSMLTVSVACASKVNQIKLTEMGLTVGYVIHCLNYLQPKLFTAISLRDELRSEAINLSISADFHWISISGLALAADDTAPCAHLYS